ncbi:MAG: TIGR02996 domain-containing protein [Myxococcaceae bacterium]
MSLARALGATDEKQKLSALLDAWRACRHSRLANVIDRVSQPLVEAAGKIKAKSMPMRTEALIAAAKSKDPVALGQVLTTEWPGTWDKALPVLQAVIAAPDDPRVAAHFARQIDETRFDTWKSAGYWRPLFAKLSSLDDLRQLPLMEAQLSRAKNHFYAVNMRFLEEDLVRGLKRIREPALSADDEKAIAMLEAPFSAAAATERHAGKSGEELLAAVYASPSDDAQRLVYGDWLVQQGDPRGEFISLQAQPPTEKSKKRLEALAKKHWKSWVGLLGDRIAGPPDFRLGFLQSARFETRNYDARLEFAKTLERPEWRTLERIVWWGRGMTRLDQALRHPNLQQVRRIDGLDYEHCKAFFESPEGLPPLTDISLPPLIERIPVGNLKSLRVLRLRDEWLPFVEKDLGGIERLVIQDAVHGLKPDVWNRLLATPVPEVTVDGYRATITLRRKRGETNFTSLEFETLWGWECVEDLFEHVPRTITRLSAPVPLERLLPDDVKALRKILASFPHLDPATIP